LGIGREIIVAPLISELRAQTSQNEPVPVISIGGEVRAPGDYPLEPGMTIMDLIRAGGGLMESAYLIDADLVRRENVDGGFREMEVLSVNLAGALAANSNNQSSFMLNPHDQLTVRTTPNWNEGIFVDLQGEFIFPGSYPIYEGEPLTSVIDRAGGFTDEAFPDGSVFLREDLAEREQEQLEILATQIESDITAIALSAAGESDNNAILTMGQALIARLRSTEANGRLAIDLGRVVEGGPNEDISLRNGDRLLVPKTLQEVTVLGEVQYATSHLYQSDLARDDYIDLSGGMTDRADERRIYIVRANGKVSAIQRSRFRFARARVGDIHPGDTVVVPLATPIRRLQFWSSVTQIMYNLAIASAAVASF
jgi:protein involved in polysaccharide export with SLBB domain